MTLTELSADVPGARLRIPRPDAANTEIDRIAYRADRAAPGAVFACLRGVRADGHDFAPEAVANGASALLVERSLDLEVPQIEVADTRLAMALMAAALEGHPSHDLTVVGVTGTNGKTTSAFLLHSVLTAAGYRSGLMGTIEARVGGVVEPVKHTTPESVDLQHMLARMREAGDDACAMEVSSHALAQRRVAGIRFAAALFTNLTRDHLDYHPDVEDYYLAKRALFLRPGGEGENPPGAANVDDEFGRRLAGESAALRFAVDATDADVRPDRVRNTRSGFTARIATPRGPLEVESRLRGRFNVSNVTGVVAVGELLGLKHDAVARGIAAVTGVPGRFEPVNVGQSFEMLVDYAHTPDSLENVLREARKLVPEGRKLIVVFGCGGDRDRGKRPQMGAIARGLADLAIVTSDNPRSEDPEAIIAEIVAGADGNGELVVQADRRAAIALAAERASSGDVVVVAGKGHERGQERNGVVSPFDDRDVAREVLGALR
jgi:UDP-N-acetylmuramoyl-L-alanyl-D-glutamate--2,6-diaminopimelate ligase